MRTIHIVPTRIVRRGHRSKHLHPARLRNVPSKNHGREKDGGILRGQVGSSRSWLAVQRSLAVLTVMEIIVQTAEEIRRWVVYSDKPVERKKETLKQMFIYTIYDLAPRSQTGPTLFLLLHLRGRYIYTHPTRPRSKLKKQTHPTHHAPNSQNPRRYSRPDIETPSHAVYRPPSLLLITYNPHRMPTHRLHSPQTTQTTQHTTTPHHPNHSPKHHEQQENQTPHPSMQW